MTLINLAIQAARKRQSSQTGFIHYCYESLDHRHDAVPFLENFCFALALFRTRLSENVLEGKALLQRLLAFQNKKQFPLYLHEYPFCRGPKGDIHIYAALYWIYHDFRAILGEELKRKLEDLLKSFPKSTAPTPPQTPEEWTEFLIVGQIEGSDLTPAFRHWDQIAYVFVGPQSQEKGEPALTLYDLFMSQATGLFAKRALSDHPVHLRVALIQPFTEESICKLVELMAKSSNFDSKASFATGFEGYRFSVYSCYLHLYFWGDASYTHSLCIEAKGEIDSEGVVALPAEYEVDEMEVAFYCDIHPDTEVLVEGQKATAFQLGNAVYIRSKGRDFRLTFSLLEGEGKFFGHIFRANRSSQISCKGENRYEAYDWKIALRTLRRSQKCKVKCLAIDCKAHDVHAVVDIDCAPCNCRG